MCPKSCRFKIWKRIMVWWLSKFIICFRILFAYCVWVLIKVSFIRIVMLIMLGVRSFKTIKLICLLIELPLIYFKCWLRLALCQDSFRVFHQSFFLMIKRLLVSSWFRPSIKSFLVFCKLLSLIRSIKSISVWLKIWICRLAVDFSICDLLRSVKTWLLSSSWKRKWFDNCRLRR